MALVQLYLVGLQPHWVVSSPGLCNLALNM